MELRTQSSLLTRETLMGELRNNILPYWMDKMVDHEHGGFYGRRNGLDKLEKQAPKGVILNTRILWTFSAPSRALKEPAYLEVADRAYDYLQQYFMDKHYGGVYWMVTYKGEPLHNKKQIYAQAFAIYAFVEYFFATGNPEPLKEAQKLFWLIERHSFDQYCDGYLEAFDNRWNLLDDLRLSEKDANEKKTMNTHLHVLEAYTHLFRCWKDPDLSRQLKNLIIIFNEKILNKDWHFDLFFNENWKVQSDEVSFGHDIEGSWLLHEAALVLGDQQLIDATTDIAVHMADTSIREGLDNDGGIMNEANHRGELIDTDKHWWPQAEALIGYVNAWQITGNDDYLTSAEKVWSFIRKYLIDTKNGEWFWRVSRTGTVNVEEDKAGPWKCPYHNGRAMLELMARLNKRD